MARTVLGLATSHNPGLNNPVDRWFALAEFDKMYIESHDLGDFDGLTLEKASWIGDEISEERIHERYDASQRGIQTLADVMANAQPDIVVTVGDDHREVFSDLHMPAMDVFWGDSVFIPPFKPRRPGMEAVDGAAPDPADYTLLGAPELGRHVIQSLIDDGFDPSHTRQLPEWHWR